MQPNTQTTPVSKGRLWTGRTLSGIAIQLRIHAPLFSAALFPVYYQPVHARAEGMVSGGPKLPGRVYNSSGYSLDYR